MKKNKRLSFFGIAKDLVHTYLQRLSDIKQLARLEARLAGRSLVTIIIFTIVLGFLVGSTWLSLLLLVFVFLVYYFQYNLIFASFVVFILNIISFGIVYYFMTRAKKNLFFPATRRQISNMRALSKD